MFCPANPSHVTTEVAPRLFQCPECGFGPGPDGERPFISFFEPESAHGEMEALVCAWDPSADVFVVSIARWVVDEQDVPIRMTIREDFVEILSTESEISQGALPVIFRGPRTAKKLHHLLFSSPLGRKEV